MMLAVGMMVVVLTAPALAQSTAGVTVERTVTTDAQGNRVVTERTFRSGVLVQIEIKTFSPQGTLLRKVEETFVGGRLTGRETVVFNAAGQVVSKVEVTFDAAGHVVKVEETTVTFQNGRRVETEREFRLVNGVLVEVEREVETIVIIDGQRVRIKQEFELRNGVLVLVEEERRVLQGNEGPGNAGDREDGGDDDRDEDDGRSGSNSGSH
ncbi:MAG TPA: hypothetical protein VNN19_03375 [bacterium]|nr:hypothetical protein [bacterium]